MEAREKIGGKVEERVGGGGGGKSGRRKERKVGRENERGEAGGRE